MDIPERISSAYKEIIGHLTEENRRDPLAPAVGWGRR
jgi:hypothetical protein